MMIELPSEDPSTDSLVNTSLLARIEMLESENAQLKAQGSNKRYFRIEDIQNDDKMVRFYTLFVLSFLALL